ncbi:MAG TPA: glutathionylspermidine synthase family protein [Savagea sp.]
MGVKRYEPASPVSLREREAFYKNYPEFFYDIDGLDYGLYDIAYVPKETEAAIRRATDFLWSLFLEAKEQLKHRPDWLEKLGYPKELIPYVTIDPLPSHTLMSRFDFVVNGTRVKMLELNNDTPFLVPEAFLMNDVLAAHFGKESVNYDTKYDLVLSFQQAIHTARHDYFLARHGEPLHVRFLTFPYDEDPEEFQTMHFLKDVVEMNVHDPLLDIDLLHIDEMTIDEDGLYDEKGQRIDILFRSAYPLEMLIDDVSSDDPTRRIGLELLELVRNKKLFLVHPPSAIILQSKIVMAYIWEQMERGAYDEKTTEQIQKYLLPTYVSAEPFIERNEPFVRKSILGREGSNVARFDGRGNCLEQSDGWHYADFFSIYQAYEPLPTIDVSIRERVTTKRYLIGSFVVGGHPSAIACRLGGTITEWDAYFLPLAKER